MEKGCLLNGRWSQVVLFLPYVGSKGHFPHAVSVEVELIVDDINEVLDGKRVRHHYRREGGGEIGEGRGGEEREGRGRSEERGGRGWVIITWSISCSFCSASPNFPMR